jgi:hypothetical protein
MAFDKWNQAFASWGTEAFVLGAGCGLLALAGFYYVVTHSLDTADSQRWDLRGPAPVSMKTSG